MSMIQGSSALFCAKFAFNWKGVVMAMFFSLFAFLPTTFASTQENAQSSSKETLQTDKAKKIRRSKRVKGLSVVKSQNTFALTLERLQGALDSRGITVVAVIDHAANAASIDQDLRPTSLLIVANPAAGTPLLQSNQTVGIDLPQKFLVWENQRGDVLIGFNRTRFLQRRHKLKNVDESLTRIQSALNAIAKEAAAPPSETP